MKNASKVFSFSLKIIKSKTVLINSTLTGELLKVFSKK